MPSHRPDISRREQADTAGDPQRGLPGSMPEVDRLIEMVAAGDVDSRRVLDERWAGSMASASPATAAAWASGLNAWLKFCEARGAEAVSPPTDVVLEFIEHLRSRYRFSTIQSRVWAITRLHILMLRPSPILAPRVQEALSCAAAAGNPKRRRAKALTQADVEAMVDASEGYSGQGFRDRAMLRLSFDAKPTSSQLVAVDIEHIVQLDGGSGVVILGNRRAGNSPQVRALLPQTMAAIADWKSFADIRDGALFRAIDRWGTIGPRLKPRQLEHCIKRAAQAAGLGSDWSCLSLRGVGLD